jgi:hypothetical protein
MTDTPEKPKNESKWTDGGPTPGGPQDKSFAYRQSRKAFIALCEKSGADVIGRVHPAKGPDGLPLFMDAAAFGPRLANAGVLVVAHGVPGAAILQALLADKAPARLPADLRLVLVHGAEPAVFAFNDPARANLGWAAKMLTAVVIEDFRKARRLAAVGLGGPADFPDPAEMAVTRVAVAPTGPAKRAIEDIIAAAG